MASVLNSNAGGGGSKITYNVQELKTAAKAAIKKKKEEEEKKKQQQQTAAKNITVKANTPSAQETYDNYLNSVFGAAKTQVTQPTITMPNLTQGRSPQFSFNEYQQQMGMAAGNRNGVGYNSGLSIPEQTRKAWNDLLNPNSAVSKNMNQSLRTRTINSEIPAWYVNAYNQGTGDSAGVNIGNEYLITDPENTSHATSTRKNVTSQAKALRDLSETGRYDTEFDEDGYRTDPYNFSDSYLQGLIRQYESKISEAKSAGSNAIKSLEDVNDAVAWAFEGRDFQRDTRPASDFELEGYARFVKGEEFDPRTITDEDRATLESEYFTWGKNDGINRLLKNAEDVRNGAGATYERTDVMLPEYENYLEDLQEAHAYNLSYASFKDEAYADPNFEYDSKFTGPVRANDNASLVYNLLNDEQALGDYEMKYDIGGTQSPIRAKGYDLMTDTELQMFNYYVKQGRGQEFLDMMEDALSHRNAAAEQALQQEFATRNAASAIASWGLVRGANLASGFMYPIQAASTMITGDTDVSKPIFSTNRLAENVTSAQMQALANTNFLQIPGYEPGTNLATWLYSAASSMADSLIGVSTGTALGGGAASKLGKVFANVIMSSEAASHTLSDGLMRGLDPTHAVLTSLADGLSEAATEKFSIDALLSDPTNFLSYFVKNFTTEASEEGASAILQTLGDQLINGDNSQYATDVRTLTMLGMDPKEANKTVMHSWFMDTLQDAMIGGISGGMSAAGRAGLNAALETSAGNRFNRQTFQNALNHMQQTQAETTETQQDTQPVTTETQQEAQPAATETQQEAQPAAAETNTQEKQKKANVKKLSKEEAKKAVIDTQAKVASIGATLEEGTEARKLADAASERLAKGKKLSGRQTYKLYTSVYQALGEKNGAAIRTATRAAVLHDLQQDGMDEDTANRLAGAVSGVLLGDKNTIDKETMKEILRNRQTRELIASAAGIDTSALNAKTIEKIADLEETEWSLRSMTYRQDAGSRANLDNEQLIRRIMTGAYTSIKESAKPVGEAAGKTAPAYAPKGTKENITYTDENGNDVTGQIVKITTSAAAPTTKEALSAKPGNAEISEQIKENTKAKADAVTDQAEVHQTTQEEAAAAAANVTPEIPAEANAKTGGTSEQIKENTKAAAGKAAGTTPNVQGMSEAAAAEFQKLIDEKASDTVQEISIKAKPGPTMEEFKANLRKQLSARLGGEEIESVNHIIVTVKDADGNTHDVDVDQISEASSDGVQALFDYAMQTPEILGNGKLNLMYQYYTGDEPTAYMTAFNSVYNAGFSGYQMSEGTIAELGGTRAQSIYNAGQQAGQAIEEQRKAAIAKAVKGKGTFSIQGITDAAGTQAFVDSLDENQRAAYDVLHGISNASGVNIVVFKSEADANGMITSENGHFDPNTNTIYLDMNAGRNMTAEEYAKQGLSLPSYAVLRTAGHEITHFMEHNSAAGYAALRDQVENELMRRGSEDFETLVATKLAEYARAGEALTRDGAISEVIADGMEMILQDSKAIQRLAQQNTGVFQRIREWLHNFADNIRKAFAGVDAGSREASMLTRLNHYNDKMIKLWDDAFIEATGIKPDAVVHKETATAEQIVDDDGSGVVDIGSMPSVQQSPRTYNQALQKDISVKEAKQILGEAFNQTMVKSVGMEDAEGIFATGRQITEAIMKQNGFSDRITRDTLSQMDALADWLENYAVASFRFIRLQDILSADIRTDPVTGTIIASCRVQNGEYPINIDFTRVCNKREAFQTFLNDFGAHIGTNGAPTELDEISLDRPAIFRMNQILKDHGYETACLGCFVEARRYSILNWANTVTKEWNAMVRKANKKAGYYDFSKGQGINDIAAEDIRKLHTELEKYEQDKKDRGNPTKRVERMAIVFDEIKRAQPDQLKLLRPADLVSVIGQTNFKDTLPQLAQVMNTAYGSAQPKTVDAVTPYNSEIALLPLKDGKLTMQEYVTSIGGVRSQSFSDFMVQHVMENLQKSNDIAARKLTAQVYTKEIGRAVLFPTGEKANMSVMFDIDPSVKWMNAGLDAEGNYIVGDWRRQASVVQEAMDTGKTEEDIRNEQLRPFTQSFPWNEAVRIEHDPMYAKTHGIIGVGYSYNHILKMLADDNIPYIIPYHSSGLPKPIKVATNISYAADYTPVQNTLAFLGYNKISWHASHEGVPSYATTAAEKKSGSKNVINAGENHLQNLLKKHNGNGPAAMHELLEFMAANNYRPATKKAGQNGHGKFDLYGALNRHVAEGDKNAHVTAANDYIAWCMNNGYTPVFFEFADNPNYYKLLYDFSVVDLTTGETAAQQTVQPSGTWMKNYESWVDKKKGNKPRKGYDAWLADVQYFMGQKDRYYEQQYGTEENPSETYKETRQQIKEELGIKKPKQHSLRTDPNTAMQEQSAVASMELIKALEDGDTERAEEIEYSDATVQYSIRESDPPKKTIIAYKAFYAKDGKLYPPMISNQSEEEQKVSKATSGTMKGLPTPVGVWLNADVGGIAVDPETGLPFRAATTGRLRAWNAKSGGAPGKTPSESNTLAFRPGWHLGEWPDAKQFNKNDPVTGEKKAVMPDDLVFAKCEIAADVDYQLDAISYGVGTSGKFNRSQAGLPMLPADGYYKYRTNPDPDTAPWYITGAMRVIEILDDDDCAEICAQFGVKPDARYSHKKINLADYGLQHGVVEPTQDIELYKKNAANYENDEILERALNDAEYASAYVSRDINFNDPKIANEFAINKQDVEEYRKLYEQRKTRKEIQQSIRFEPLTSTREYIMGLDRDDLASDAEKAVLAKYKAKVTEYGVATAQREKIDLELLSYKGTDHSQLQKLYNQSQLARDKQARIQTELENIEKSNPFIKIAGEARKAMSAIQTAASSGNVSQYLDNMRQRILAAQGRMDNIVRELEGMPRASEGTTARWIFGKKELEDKVRQIMQTNPSTLSRDEVTDSLAHIALLYNLGDVQAAEDANLEIEALARKLQMQKQETIESYELTQLADAIGTFSLNAAQKAEVKRVYGSINNFKKALQGYGKYDPKAANLDDNWNEMVAMTAGLLPANVGDAQEPVELVNLITQTVQAAENAMALSPEDMQLELADIQVQILTAATDLKAAVPYTKDTLKTIQTFIQSFAVHADNLEKHIMDLLNDTDHARADADAAEATFTTNAGKVIKGVNAIRTYYGQVADQYTKEIMLEREKALKAKYEDRIKLLRSKAALKLEQNVHAYQDLLARERERRDLAQKIRTARNIVRRSVMRVNKALTQETNQKHVPEELKGLAEAIVKSFADADKYGRGIILSQSECGKILTEYAYLMQRDGDLDSYGYDADMLSMLAQLQDQLEQYHKATWLGGYNDIENQRKRLDLVKNIADVMENLSAMITNSNTIFVAGKMMTIGQAAASMANPMAALEDFHTPTGAAGNAAVKADDFARWGNMTPYYFKRQVDNAGLTTLMDDLEKSEHEWGLGMQAAHDRLSEIRNNYHYYDWTDDTVSIPDGRGGTVELTREQAMSILAIWNREHYDKYFQSQHLEFGGFVLADDGKKRGKGLLGLDKNPLHRTLGTLVTGEDIETIRNFLTDEQKAYMQEIINYLSNDMSDIGNETSMKLYGIKKYKEKYYFPIQSYRGGLTMKSDAGSVNPVNDSRIEHVGFSNSRLRNSNNTVIISDFSETAAGHIQQMLMYSNFAPTIEALNRTLNAKWMLKSGREVRVRQLFQIKYGQNATGYLQDYIKALNGGVNPDPQDSLAGKMISLFKKTAVVGSLSVAAKQPMSIIRAATMINPRYLAAAVAKNVSTLHGQKSFEEAAKYAGTAVIKDIGKFDTGVGMSNVDWLLEHEAPDYDIWSKAKEALNPREWEQWKARWNDILGFLPSKGDSVTWGAMWEAVKMEQHALHPGMNQYTTEFLKMCGERFNTIMRATQVYDSTISRSPNIRSRSQFMKMLTAFMNEPVLTVNMLYDAVKNAKKTGMKDHINPAAAGAAFLLSAAAQAFITSLFSALRSDDKDKTIAEKMAGSFGQNLRGEINVFGLIPGIADIVEILEGGDVERTDLSVLSDAVSKFEKLFSGKYAITDFMSGWKAVEDIAGSVAKLFGVPLKNLMREVRTVHNVFTQPARATNPTVLRLSLAEGLHVLPDSFMGLTLIDTSSQGYIEKMYQALRKGNAKAAADYKEYLTQGKGIKEGSIASKMKSLLYTDYVNEKISIDDAIQFGLDQGLWEKEKDAYAAIIKAADKKAHAGDDEYTTSAYIKIHEALLAGDRAAYNAAVQDMVSHGYTENGIKSAAKGQIGDWYKAGELDESTAKAMLAMLGITGKYDVHWTLDSWQYAQENGSSEGYSMYDDFIQAVETGRGLSSAIQEQITYSEKTEKEVKSILASRITSTFKDQYVELVNSGRKSEAANLQARLLTAYEALGYDRKKKIKDIARWLN